MDPQTPTEFPINTYFAVQILQAENPMVVAGAICRAGHEKKTLFRRLEVLDTIQIAGKSFVRCRSDVVNPHPLLGVLFAQNRAYVAAGPGGIYVAYFPGGRVGNVPGSTLHMVPRSPVMYRGPKMKLWERQFME